MSGRGKRFSDAGFTRPKPLIPIDGLPMFIKSFNSFPKLNKWIFFTTEKISKMKYFLDSINKTDINFTIEITKKTTKGQADSCKQAIESLQDNTPFFVAPCDFELSDKIKKETFFKNKEEIIVLNYMPSKYHFENPNDYGWVQVDENLTINAIEVKTLGKIEQKKAKIISGFFVFKNKEIYNKYYQKMVNDKKEINGEYYIDTLCKVAIENGSKVLGLLIDKGRSYGTPHELKNLS